MPILLWVVYPFVIWSACFGVPPAGVYPATDNRESQ
jgi:hypothetical protein